MASLVLLLLLLAAVFAWMAGGRAGRRGRRRAHPGVTDPDELAAAETEVEELDAFTSPEDADDQLPDWGPGAGQR
jgi:hypothetical protein